MKKRVLCLFAAVIFLVTAFAGCGARTAKSEASPAAYSQADKTEAKSSGDENFGAEPSRAEEAKADAKQVEAPKEPDMDATALTGTGSANQSVSNAILAQRKIIRNANVTIEVDDFDVAYGKINTFISGIGFIQETNIKKGKIYINNQEKLVTRGVIIVRVDKSRFDEVMNDIRGLGLLLDQQIKTDDVTERFFDIESRLRLLRFEESRLEAYLKKLEDPDKIFKTESRLTDIRHEIEGLTGTLRKLSDLTELSTITINLNEKIPGSNVVRTVKPKSYGDRLLGNFLDSVKGVVSFCGELLIILVQALPVLVLLGLFLLIILVIYKKISKNVAITKNKDNDSQI